MTDEAAARLRRRARRGAGARLRGGRPGGRRRGRRCRQQARRSWPGSRSSAGSTRQPSATRPDGRGRPGRPGITGVSREDRRTPGGSAGSSGCWRWRAADRGRRHRGGGPADRPARRLRSRPHRRCPEPDRDRRRAASGGRVRRPGRRWRGDGVGGARRPDRHRARRRLHVGSEARRRRAPHGRDIVPTRRRLAPGDQRHPVPDSMTDRTSSPPLPRPRLVERYRRFLPVTDETPPLTLGEGATPLVHARVSGRRSACRTSTSRSRARTRPARSRTAAWSWRSPRRSRRARRAIVCASTGQHLGIGGGLRRGGRARGRRRPAERARSRSASCSRRSSPGARVVAIDGNFDQALAIVRGARRTGRPPGDAGELGQPVPARGPEDGRVRDLRRPRPGARRARHPGRQRRQHQRLLGRVPRLRRRRASSSDAAAVGLPGGRCRAARASATGSSTRRRSRPRSGSATRRRGRWRSRRATSPAAGSRPSPTTRSWPRTATLARLRGRVLRAGVGGRRSRASRRPPRPARSTRATRSSCVLTGHGLKDPDTAERQVPPVLEADGDRRARSRSRSAGEERTMAGHWLAELDGRRVTVEVPATSREPRRRLRLPRRSRSS